jgi:hypothetical protein
LFLVLFFKNEQGTTFETRTKEKTIVGESLK